MCVLLPLSASMNGLFEVKSVRTPVYSTLTMSVSKFMVVSAVIMQSMVDIAYVMTC